MTPASFPSLLQRFFSDRLIGQLSASPHTVASYRDAFRLLLRFAAERLHRNPSDLNMDQLDEIFVTSFLDHLERKRGSSVRTRNTRLAALHAFFRYVAISEPAYALRCQRVLAIPSKRYVRKPVEFLTRTEVDALVAAPDPGVWIGRRDRALLVLAAQTGFRNSELRALRMADVTIGTGSHVRCQGKGRKMRCTPLRADVVAVLRAWLAELKGQPSDPLFPSSRGGPLSADALQRRVAKHAATARRSCPSLIRKIVTPHKLRHAAAMELLRHGIDLSVIALWLGHESRETTEIYLHADMKLKEQALAHAMPSGIAPARYKPQDNLLAFLESL
jgi:site-specific recombinase XerD